MRVYKCDRCGAIFEYDEKVSRDLHIQKDIKDDNGWLGTVDVDLCPQCYDRLVDFLTLNEKLKEIIKAGGEE